MNDLKIYRCFHDSDNNELWAKYDGLQIHTLLNHELTLDTKLKTYLENKFNVVRTILYDFDKTYLNSQGIRSDENLHFDSHKDRYKITKSDRTSSDGFTYKIFKQTTTDKGWGVFLNKDSDGNISVVNENYWYDLVDYMSYNFLIDKKIDFERIQVGDFNKFIVSPENFK